MTLVDGAGVPVGPVQTGERHPRAAGFRDGFVSAVLLVAIALAAGLLAVPGSAAHRPFGSSAPSEGAALAAPTPNMAPQPGEVSPPPIAALTVVWIPPDDFVRGAEMWPGCTFSFDFGPAGGGIIWRTCSGPEAPAEPLRTLYAKAGATVSIENSTFTPSTRPAMPAVACGTITRAGVFVADPDCHVTYAAGQRGEFTFGLPPVPGSWVLAVQGCLQSVAAACGAWYAKVDTIDPPPAP